jgi:hypothetical protein
MKRYEIRNGTDPDSTVVGIVHALDEMEAVSTLQAHMNGLGVFDPGVGVPVAWVEWADHQIKQLHYHSVQHWRAYELKA